MDVQILFKTLLSSFGYIFRSGVTESYDNSFFFFFLLCRRVLTNVVTFCFVLIVVTPKKSF